MRINKYVASATGMSRRSADTVIADLRVQINGAIASAGQEVGPGDKVALDGRIITPAVKTITIMLNKPTGYVCSRDGQGSRTVYELLPPELHHLKPVGRLDKDSSGLLLLTNYGQLAHELTHPSFQKEKTYEVQLDKDLSKDDQKRITEEGVKLEDGISKLSIAPKTYNLKPKTYIILMHEGRNRQIRRTFAALGYYVTRLHRTSLGPLKLDNLKPGTFKEVNTIEMK